MATKKARGKTARKKKGRGSGELERYQKALEGLERAIKALHKGDVERAHEQFLKLAENHGNEKELLDRVRSYVGVCEQKFAQKRRPKTAEEMTTCGVMCLNDGDTQQAIKHLSKALEMDPQSGHIHYCLAAAHARSGDAAAAARHLKQAIQTEPLSRTHARRDADFAAVRETSEVATLLAGA